MSGTAPSQPLPAPAPAASGEVPRWRLAVLPLLLIALRATMASGMELAGDEAYYWVWSRSLAGGYFDHPPMVAWLIRLSVGIFGTNELGVRMPAILLAAGSMLLAGDIARICGATGRTVLGLQAALFCLPIIQVQAAIMTPDTPALFFLLATISWGLRYLLEPASPRHWLMLGTTAGLAMLSKYTTLIPIAAIFVFVLMTRPKHTARTLMAGAVAVLVLWPVLMWNYQHDWISFRFQLNHGMGSDARPWWSTFPDYIGGQLLAATPVLAVLMLWAAGRTLRRGTDPRTRLLAVAACTMLAFFAFSSLRHKVEVNWPTAAWPILLILLVLHVQRLGGKAAELLRVGVIVSAVFTVVINMPPAFLARLNKHAPAGSVGGWKQLAREAKKRAGNTPIYATRYQDAARLAFYVPGRPWVRVLRRGPDRMSQYDVPPYPRLPEGNIVIVADAPIRPGEATMMIGDHSYQLTVSALEQLKIDLDGIQTRLRHLVRARIHTDDEAGEAR